MHYKIKIHGRKRKISFVSSDEVIKKGDYQILVGNGFDSSKVSDDAKLLFVQQYGGTETNCVGEPVSAHPHRIYFRFVD